MQFAQNTIAMIYDFDGTLSPKAMQDYTLLPKFGIPEGEFWREVQAEVDGTGAENMLVYMRLLLEKARERGINIRRKDYRSLAHKIRYFAGVEQWFDLINRYVRNHSKGIRLKHYLISAGMREIIDGTSIKRHFNRIYASEYHFNPQGAADFPKLVITDTTKTQYLFRINKGREHLGESINEHMDETERPIPFNHMIYIGDGMTDVPSMAVMRKNSGHAIAVYRENNRKQLETCRQLLAAGRVDFIAKADWRDKRELFKRTTLLLDAIIANIEYERELFRCNRQHPT
ncbi:MAG TPA: haloacid dehalogenase-like hydrolase [Gammaproteobacteria bacterium]